MLKARQTPTRQQTSEAASLLGKRSWTARVKRFGLKRLQEMAAKMGRNSKGRPRLPDDRVSKGALYQRARRERLKQEAEAENQGKGR